MSQTIEEAGQAAEARTDDLENLAPGQAGEESRTDAAGEGKGEGGDSKPLYTPEELEAIHPKDIDLDRVDPSSRKIVERTVNEYKALQGGFTKVTQELREERKKIESQQESQKPYFDDEKKNGVFQEYLKNPAKIKGDIRSEIARLRATPQFNLNEDNQLIPNPEYERNMHNIGYWEGVMDDFNEKRIEIAESKRRREVEDEKVRIELGDKAQAIEDYALEMGYSLSDFRAKPKVREAVKKTYDLLHASTTAKTKEVKAAAPSRLATQAGGGTTKREDSPDKKSTGDWIAERNKAAFGR